MKRRALLGGQRIARRRADRCRVMDAVGESLDAVAEPVPVATGCPVAGWLAGGYVGAPARSSKQQGEVGRARRGVAPRWYTPAPREF